MSEINTIGNLIDNELEGRVRNYTWRKTPSQATVAGLWFDLALSPGNPSPKYWFDAAPGVAKAITQSGDGGFYHGPNVSPSKKFLRIINTTATAATALPMNVILMDYLLYYPSIDDGITDPQVMDNTVTLPRYADGKGVQMMAITVAARTGGAQFFVTYTNQDGVTGRTSGTVTQNTSTAIGTVTTSGTATGNGANPFIPLQLGDSGVRKIESVTMLSPDVGLMSIILVKPLAQTCFREITVPYEKDILIYNTDMPRIYDDAFLSMVALPGGTLAATVLTGYLKVIWT
jgi:cyclophilin family peptidyl-prolyl cis-trans isomerase